MVIDEMNLNELESLELLQKLGEHLRKNNTEHLIDQVFNMNDYEADNLDLIQQVQDLEKDKSELEEDNVILLAKIDEAISKIKIGLSETVSDVEQELLEEILNILE